MYTPEAEHTVDYYRQALALASGIKRAHSSLSPRERVGGEGPAPPGEKPLTLTLSRRERGHDGMSKSEKVA